MPRFRLPAARPTAPRAADLAAPRRAQGVRAGMKSMPKSVAKGSGELGRAMMVGEQPHRATGTGLVVVGTRRAATLGTLRGDPAIWRGSVTECADSANATHKPMARHGPRVWSTALAFRTSSLLAKCNTVVLVCKKSANIVARVRKHVCGIFVK